MGGFPVLGVRRTPAGAIVALFTSSATVEGLHHSKFNALNPFRRRDPPVADLATGRAGRCAAVPGGVVCRGGLVAKPSTGMMWKYPQISPRATP